MATTMISQKSPLSEGFLSRHARRVNDIISHKFHHLPVCEHPQGKVQKTQTHSCSSAARPDYRRIKCNEHGQRQCKGCDEISELLRWGEAQRRREPEYTGSSQSRIIHSNYRELDVCARVSCCDTCQTIRRGFLLEQITGLDAARLEDPDKQWPVHAVLNMCPAGDSLAITVERPNDTLFSTTIPLQRQRNTPVHNPTRNGGRLRADFDELRQVVRECHENHECSSKYRWSDRNPSWLLEILPDNRIRLVRGPEQLVDYVVLSYSWGDPATMPAAEWARIKAAGTKSKNGLPVPERLNPFPRTHLPETMQDAITITESLGFHYVWIDNVCIPKGTNWDTEASMMHEVYGNAAFTLAASASTKATDRLLVDRLAWSHRSKACKLRGQWLYNAGLSLDRVRLGSAVSQRGWTLQEERLSPRVLYWAGQRWYWSCPEQQVVELSELVQKTGAEKEESWSLPHQFLAVCRSGDDEQLQEEWLDIVEAYSRRDLAQPKDRFLAISGLAVRFFNAKAECGGGGGGKTRVTEEYLAGLWRDNFARHLAWSVAKAARPEENLQHIAPSWSWASLPMRVHTKTKHDFEESKHFQFIGTKFTEAQLQEDKTADLRERGQVIEERGRNVRVVEVRGRFRRFISAEGGSSQKVPWSDIEWKRGNRLGFDFKLLPGRRLHARNMQDGRIVAKEAHGGEIVGQLDYLAAAPTAPSSVQHQEAADDDDEITLSDDKVGVCLPDGAETELMCLELGELAMLLLQRVPTSSSDGETYYRRVGVCIGYENRKGFFYGCEARSILLV
ncbi:heterokaryon incompatibility protein-domain-containing protein [Apodospora peruviana]|uniref:Heterokaryon incompatibility protein-domain-containing protein n=1 Tax=Apodospora peruviana TaxID=516989 RepID=A0AAE0M0M4_9PEZI|nr:heterokaryon incompatibility protein-domain-containing protein [Apodospora peruviana]